MLGPDGKIYIASGYHTTSNALTDSMNSHLHVIQFPDGAGPACGFNPYSFSLNNRRSYLSLPNMPNYNLGILEGVNCDSILTTNSIYEIQGSDISVFPNPGNGLVTISRNYHEFESLELSLTDVQARNIRTVHYSTPQKIISADFSDLPEGVYILKMIINHRFVVCKKLVVSR